MEKWQLAALGLLIALIFISITMVVVLITGYRYLKKLKTEIIKTKEFHFIQAESEKKAFTNWKRDISTSYMQHFLELQQKIRPEDLNAKDEQMFRKILTDVVDRNNDVFAEYAICEFIHQHSEKPIQAALTAFAAQQNEGRLSLDFQSEVSHTNLQLLTGYQIALLRLLFELVKVTYEHTHSLHVRLHISITEQELCLQYLDPGIEKHGSAFKRVNEIAQALHGKNMSLEDHRYKLTLDMVHGILLKQGQTSKLA